MINLIGLFSGLTSVSGDTTMLNIKMFHKMRERAVMTAIENHINQNGCVNGNIRANGTSYFLKLEGASCDPAHKSWSVVDNHNINYTQKGELFL